MDRVRIGSASHRASFVPRVSGLIGMALTGAPAMAAEGVVELPHVSVSGSRDGESFRTKTSASPKNTEPLLDTPRSIAVIPQEVIRTTAATELSQVLRTVPGITFGAGEGGNPLGDQPFIRGYNAQASTFVDGMRDIGAQSREVFNTESVEVSKGPAGAYDGRGSAGGSINIVTKTPQLGSFADGTLAVGNARTKRATVDGNWQFAQAGALRLNAMAHDAGIAGRDVARNERWGIAPSLAFGLGTPTRVLASYYHLQSDDMPDVGLPYNNPEFKPRKDGRPRVLEPGDGSPLDVPRHTWYGLKDRDFRKEAVDQGTLRFEHDFSPALKLRNQTRLAHGVQDYVVTYPDSLRTGNIYYGMVHRRPATRYSTTRTIANQTDLSGEFHTGTVKHSYAAGLEFSYEKASNDRYVVDAGSNACPSGPGAAGGYNCTTLSNPNPDDPWRGSIRRQHAPAVTTIRTASAYLFDSAHLGAQWIVSGGLRFDRYSVDGTAPNSRTQYTRDDSLLNYQAGVIYKPVPDASVYLSYGTASKPAGSMLGQGREDHALLPSGTQRGDHLAPEKNRAFEVGAKWDVVHDRLALSAALFRIDTTNARITLEDGSYAMAGKKRVDGVELGLTGNLTNKWSVFGGYVHQKSELSKAGGAGAAFGAQDGDAFPNTPSDSFSLWTTYKILPKVTLGGGAFYTSKVWGNEAGNRWVPPYWRFDAMAAWQINKHAVMQLNVDNLADKRYYNKAQPSHYATLAPGRTVLLSLNLRY